MVPDGAKESRRTHAHGDGWKNGRTYGLTDKQGHTRQGGKFSPLVFTRGGSPVRFLKGLFRGLWAAFKTDLGG